MRKLAVLLAFLMLASVFCPLAVLAEEVISGEDKVSITYVLIDKYDDFLSLIPKVDYELPPSDDPDAPPPSELTTIIVKVDRGHKITDDEVPGFDRVRIGGYTKENYYYDAPDWELSDPHEYVANEDMTFYLIPVATGKYYVDFIEIYGHWTICSYSKVEAGASVEAPEVEPVIDDQVFLYWDVPESEYSNVHRNMRVFTIRETLGNLNRDERYSEANVDSADATILLRGLVNPENNPEYFDRLADVNQNGEADPADATLILRSCVGE